MDRGRVAIIGGGAAGLSAAHYLRGRHDVRIFEREPRAGGHIYPLTIQPSEGPAVDIDIAFAFFVRDNCPTFSSLLDELGVRTRAFEGRISVWDQGRAFGFRRADLRKGVPAQLSPRFTADSERFLVEAARLRDSPAGEDASLGEHFRRHGYDEDAIRYTIVPFIATYWGFDWRTTLSLSHLYVAREIDRLRQSARAFRAGSGGVEVIDPTTRHYLERLMASTRAEILTGTDVVRVKREGGGALVVTRSGAQRFDAVIMAVHADHALRLLDEPTEAERRYLGATKYHDVPAVIHTDTGMLPADRSLWEHFNYVLYENPIPLPATTWFLNEIFGFSGRPHLLTIGEACARIAPDTIVQTVHFRHPVMTPEAFGASGLIDSLNAGGPIHYCGSYAGNGGHEAAIASAKRVGERLSQAA